MVKNILFDFGAVLIPIDQSLTNEAFKELGANEDLINQNKIFHTYEKGEISTDEFLNKIRPFFFRKIFKPDLAKAWNALLPEPIPDENIRLIQRLKKEYQLFLLSNTNELHINSIKETTGMFSYSKFIRQFDHVYYSYEMGMRKPNKNIFQKVIKNQKIKPEETLYVDDNKANIATGESLGFKTWHFDPEADSILQINKHL